jgi:hypothetical protein
MLFALSRKNGVLHWRERRTKGLNAQSEERRESFAAVLLDPLIVTG